MSVTAAMTMSARMAPMVKTTNVRNCNVERLKVRVGANTKSI